GRHRRRADGPAGGVLGDPRAPLVPDKYITLTPELYGYVVEHGARQDDVLRRLADDTQRLGDISIMQIAPEQGAFVTLLMRATGGLRARSAPARSPTIGSTARCWASRTASRWR